MSSRPTAPPSIPSTRSTGGGGRPFTPAEPGSHTVGDAAALSGLLRIGQWPKNLLVLAAPFAAGNFAGSAGSTVAGFEHLALAVAAWCLVSSATYILNDYRDRERDRLHPVKRLRPLAAGAVNPTSALILAAALGVLGLLLGWQVSPRLSGLLVVYAALMVAYSIELKNVAVLELLIVASGFPMRAVSGGYALGIPVTPWFVFVVSSAALMVVAAKRLSELRRMGTSADDHRKVLGEYSEPFLTQVHTLAIAFFLGVYVVWAVSVAEATASRPALTQFSVAPIALVVLRFALLTDRGLVDQPEELLYRDRVSQLCVLAWAITFYAGVVGW